MSELHKEVLPAGEHRHSRFIQHHFDGPAHQFDTGKFAIWCFLAQEVLFFSALFVAYILYRVHHPEIFAYGSQYLDTTMGAVNTCVLILSSLSAAWAVRAAQLNQQKALVFCLAVTLLCACGFLGIKYVEYSAKIHHGTLYGQHFKPHQDPKGEEFPEAVQKAPPSSGVAKTQIESYQEMAEKGESPAVPPPNTSMFFTIYFAMTGLHGIHVLVGVVIFIWLLFRALRGHFGPGYYGPIDYAALYWHLVDLIWIFLFPLFYLI